MQQSQDPEDFEEKIRKPNRLRKLQKKTHKIEHEAGSSLKNLWDRIVARSKEKEEGS